MRYGVGLIEREACSRANGVDAVLDLAGGQALEDRPAAAARPAADRVDPGTQRVAELDGHYMFVRPDTEQLARLVSRVDEGWLRIDVAKTFPLANAETTQKTHEDGGITARSSSPSRRTPPMPLRPWGRTNLNIGHCDEHDHTAHVALVASPPPDCCPPRVEDGCPQCC